MGMSMTTVDDTKLLKEVQQFIKENAHQIMADYTPETLTESSNADAF